MAKASSKAKTQSCTGPVVNPGPYLLDSCRFERIQFQRTHPGVFICGDGASARAIQRARRHRTRRPGRAALCLDRARDGAVRRLGHAAALRPAMVRETSALLLGRGHRLQTLSLRGVGGANAFGICSVVRGADACLAGTKALRRKNRVGHFANFLDHDCRPRVCARSNPGHAICRESDDRHGLCHRSFTRATRSKFSRRFASSDAARTTRQHRTLRGMARRRRARERTGRSRVGWRKHRAVDDLHAAMARGNAAGTSGGDWRVRDRRGAVVRAVRHAQSRFPAHISISSQRPALLDAGIPTPATVLVFRANSTNRAASLVSVTFRGRRRRLAHLAAKNFRRFARLLLRLLGNLSNRLLQLLAIEIAGLHSSGSASAGASLRSGSRTANRSRRMESRV